MPLRWPHIPIKERFRCLGFLASHANPFLGSVHLLNKGYRLICQYTVSSQECNVSKVHMYCLFTRNTAYLKRNMVASQGGYTVCQRNGCSTVENCFWERTLHSTQEIRRVWNGYSYTLRDTAFFSKSWHNTSQQHHDWEVRPLLDAVYNSLQATHFNHAHHPIPLIHTSTFLFQTESSFQSRFMFPNVSPVQLPYPYSPCRVGGYFTSKKSSLTWVANAQDAQEAQLKNGAVDQLQIGVEGG